MKVNWSFVSSVGTFAATTAFSSTALSLGLDIPAVPAVALTVGAQLVALLPQFISRCMKSLHRLKTVDENLITLFDHLPLANKPVFRGSDADRAVQIRSWMDRSQDVLDQISGLNLSSKNLSAIPPEMERLHNLKCLSLFDNNITTLQHLPVNLKLLYVGRNQLRNIDGVIWPNTLENHQSR